MALQIHGVTPFTSKSYHWHHTCYQFKHYLTVHARKPSEFLKPITTNNADDNTTTSTANTPEKPTSSGLGFGSPSSSLNKPSPKKSSKRERATIVRRSPVGKPAFLLEKDESKNKERGIYESAFLLSWLGFGGFILLEGVALAASGFLPEELDKLFVGYLYPSFTPTVLLFFSGTVAYGVLKYTQNERMTGQK